MLISRYTPLVAVSLPAPRGRQFYMHEFDLANPSVPKGFEDYLEPVKELIKAAKAFVGTAFLTVDEKVIKPGCTQRRPGPHVDGHYMKAQGIWGHPVPGWNHFCNEVPVSRMPVIVAASVAGCRVWEGDFDAEPKNDGDLSHLALGEGKLVPANVGYLLSPDCVHESLPFEKETPRTFIRIALPATA